MGIGQQQDQSLFLPARLTSISTKSVTYMPGTFCYRHARPHTLENKLGFKPLNQLVAASVQIFPQPALAARAVSTRNRDFLRSLFSRA